MATTVCSRGRNLLCVLLLASWAPVGWGQAIFNDGFEREDTCPLVCAVAE